MVSYLCVRKNAIIHLKPKLVYILFKHSIHTAKKTLHLTITKITAGYALIYWNSSFRK
jgi:hypothetical protein